MLPSVKAIERGLNVSTDVAKQVRYILSSPNFYKIFRQALVRPKGFIVNELKLWAINELLGLYGVEVISQELGHPRKRYDLEDGTIILYYINRGDTYNVTVLYDPIEDKFSVGSWGDWYETHTKEAKWYRHYNETGRIEQWLP